jgi:hypothetical protein
MNLAHIQENFFKPLIGYLLRSFFSDAYIIDPLKYVYVIIICILAVLNKGLTIEKIVKS